MVWCGVFFLFIKWFIFLVGGGYFLIKGIKWELIRIKGELGEN